MGLKTGKYGRSEFVIAGESLPPLCLRWALHTLFVPENRGLIDVIAINGVQGAMQWKINIRDDKGEDIGSISKATCQVVGCVAACRLIGEDRPSDGATRIKDVYRNLDEPGFSDCLRPPPPEDPSETPVDE